MDRRAFLKDGTLAAVSAAARERLRCGFGARRLMAVESPAGTPNPDWLAAPFQVRATASSFYGDPPGGYGPANVRGDNLFTGWETDQQTAGAWLQVDFSEPRAVAEMMILAPPLPRDIGPQPNTASEVARRCAFFAFPRSFSSSNPSVLIGRQRAPAAEGATWRPRYTQCGLNHIHTFINARGKGADEAKRRLRLMRYLCGTS